MAKARARVVSRKEIYQGKVFGVIQERVIEPGGVEATRDIVTHSGSVVLLPVLDDGRILMIRQYRHTVGDFLLELVAGRMEPGESAVTAAHRELAEETGYRAKHLRKMMRVFPTPGFVREPMTAFAATGLTLGKTHFDDDERIQLRPFKLKVLLEMIKRGKIHDMKSVAGILYYSRFVAKQKK